MVYLCYICLYALVFITGACIGSFLNVCIYRLPENQSLIKRNSHCMTCGADIKKRDLIPIVSWILLKGKCRSCKAAISPRYTVVEAMNAVMYVLLFVFIDDIALAAVTCLCFSALIVVFFTDLDTMTINIYVIIFIALMGIPKYIFTSDYTGITLKSQIIGALIVGVPLLLLVIITKERAMGLGDAYLMIAAGFYLGVKSVLIAAMAGLIIGCIVGMAKKIKTGESRFAFGPYLCIGIAIGALWGVPLADMYLKLTGLA